MPAIEMEAAKGERRSKSVSCWMMLLVFLSFANRKGHNIIVYVAKIQEGVNILSLLYIYIISVHQSSVYKMPNVYFLLQ